MALRNTEHMSKCEKCRYYCRSGTTFLFSHIGLCGLVFGYTVIGALMFQALEAKNESDKREEMALQPNKVVQELWLLTSNSSVLNETKWMENANFILKDFSDTLVDAIRRDGFDGNFNVTGSPQWSFSGALLYSIIVITTIGYGNIAPKTNTGKIVTILYAIVGIPLLLLCLSNIGDAMAHSFKFIYWKVCCYLCTSPKPTTNHRKNRSNRSSRHPSEARGGTLQRSSSGKDYDSLKRKMYDGTPMQYDRQRTTYQSTDSPQHSLKHNHHGRMHSGDSEASISDAHKVPVISNKYVLNLAESQVSTLYRQQPLRSMNALDTSYHQQHGSPFLRNTPSGLARLQESLPSSFMPICDEMDFGDAISISSDRDEDGSEEASVPITLCIAIVVGYICGGAYLFSEWESWEYSDSCYFCFITLTTIGFGDMVPGTAVLSEDAQLALGLCSLYLLFGMALLAMSFNLVQEEVTKSVTTIGKRIGILSDNDDDDE